MGVHKQFSGRGEKYFLNNGESWKTVYNNKKSILVYIKKSGAFNYGYLFIQ